MKATFGLVKRNLTIYFRDPTGIFLSLLGAIILLLLYALFLGSLQVDTIRAQLPQASDDEITTFVSSWVFAGILMMTTFTSGLGALSAFVDDRVTDRFKEFRVMPVRPGQIVLGYQIAAFVVALTMSTLVLAVGYVTLGIMSSTWAKPLFVLQAFGCVALMCFAFASFSSFIVSFVVSHSAFTAVNTIIGTVLGFLAGAYLPIGTVSVKVANVINALPFSPSAMLLRRPLAGDPLTDLSGGIAEAETILGEYYGFDLQVGSTVLKPEWILIELAVIAIVFTALSAVRIGRRIK